jgi:REP element-mobilizing transposase RayT
MSRRLRYQPEEWTTQFVTHRCIHSRFLLRPSKEVNELVVGVLHRAGQHYEVKLHAVAVLSGHLHLVVTPRTATDLASYMCFVGSNISKEVGKLHDWPQSFWGGRYASALCLDDEAVVDPSLTVSGTFRPLAEGRVGVVVGFHARGTSSRGPKTYSHGSGRMGLP